MRLVLLGLVVGGAWASELGDKLQRTLDDSAKLYQRARNLRNSLEGGEQAALDAGFGSVVQLAESVDMLERRWNTLHGRAVGDTTIDLEGFTSKVVANIGNSRELTIELANRGVMPRIALGEALLAEAATLEEPGETFAQADATLAETVAMAESAGALLAPEHVDRIYHLGLEAAAGAEAWESLATWAQRCIDRCTSATAPAHLALAQVAVARDRDKVAAQTACHAASRAVGATDDIGRTCDKLAGKAWRKLR